MTRRPIPRIADAGDLPAAMRGAVVAVGNFDGVHRGHQAVLGHAAELAAAQGRPLVCLTFEPHPRTVFAPDRPVARLTPGPLKALILAELGFDAVVEQAFTRDFAAASAQDFVTDRLVGALGAAHVVVGYDFRFGARRAGTAGGLAEFGRALGFGVSVIDEFDDEGGAVVSSSRIRSDLEAGDIAGANALLGYRWMVQGTIGHGRKIGRTIGFPTANMVLADERLLMHGIYAVALRQADGALHRGVASFGRRPTFDDGPALFETWLFDFDGDLYGEDVTVSLFARLRGEEKFDGVPALVAQMRRDADLARDHLAAARPLSALDGQLAFQAGFSS